MALEIHVFVHFNLNRIVSEFSLRASKQKVDLLPLQRRRVARLRASGLGRRTDTRGLVPLEVAVKFLSV